MDKGDDPYRILGLYKSDITVDPSSIKKAYRQLARIHHPDKNNGEGTSNATLTFAKISHAYEILRGEESRRSYDLSQLHCDQQGYDPNGPTYYDSTNRYHADVNGKNNNTTTKKTKKNSSTTESPKRRTTYYPVVLQPAHQQQQHQKKKHQPDGGGDLFSSSRTATTTTTDTVSGKPKTFSYTTTSEGITTVDVKAPNGTSFSFSVHRHDEDKHKEVYDLFRGQFGRDSADDFFNIVGNNNSSSVGLASEKKNKSTKSKSKSNSKKAKENRITLPPSSPTRVVTNLYAIPPTITTSTSSSKPTNTTKSKKQKKKKTVPNMTRRILPLSNTDTNTIAKIDNTNGDIRSMSTKERIVVNPKTKRKEVVVKTTLSKFDGSVETITERRQL